MGMRATIEGLDELPQAIVEAKREIRAGLEAAVEEGADAIRDDARGDVPVGETRKLREGIEVEVESDLRRTVGVFGEAAEYGPFVELGTSSRPAQPFMGPAAERERSRFPRRVTREVNARLG